MSMTANRTTSETWEPRQSHPVRTLPTPELTGLVSLEETLRRRRSVREFTGRPLSDREISQLLWAAQGVTHRDGRRTAPSAGALYPLELFVATAAGFFQYEPPHHRLRRLSEDDLRPALQWAALSQEPLGEAPAIFVIAALPQRTAAKYDASVVATHIRLEPRVPDPEPHYDDLLALWARHAHFPLLYSRGAVEKQAREKLLLIPAATPRSAIK